jgi:hypothetical protein
MQVHTLNTGAHFMYIHKHPTSDAYVPVSPHRPHACLTHSHRLESTTLPSPQLHGTAKIKTQEMSLYYNLCDVYQCIRLIIRWYPTAIAATAWDAQPTLYLLSTPIYKIIYNISIFIYIYLYLSIFIYIYIYIYKICPLTSSFRRRSRGSSTCSA